MSDHDDVARVVTSPLRADQKNSRQLFQPPASPLLHTRAQLLREGQLRVKASSQAPLLMPRWWRANCKREWKLAFLLANAESDLHSRILLPIHIHFIEQDQSQKSKTMKVM